MKPFKSAVAVATLIIISLMAYDSFANMTSMYDTSMMEFLDQRNFEDMKIRLSGEDVKITVDQNKTIVEGEYYFKVKEPNWGLKKYTLYMPQYVPEDQDSFTHPEVSVGNQKLKTYPLHDTPQHYAHITQVPGQKTIWWNFDVPKAMVLANNPVTIDLKYEQLNFKANNRTGTIYVPMIPKDADITDYPDNFKIEVIAADGVTLEMVDSEGKRNQFTNNLSVTPEHLKPIIAYILKN